MLKRVEGDIIELVKDGHFDVIIHGCNCQNTMGAGLAKRLKQEWPGVYEADIKATATWPNPIAKLGNFSSYVNLHHKIIVINAYTQLGYGRGDRFEYESFYLILKKLEALDPIKNVRYGFPMIGMGLAGGDPDRIIPMIEDFATRHDTTLVEYKP